MEIKKLSATLQKSYYGKAKVITDDAADVVSLKSYNTIVCQISKGRFIRTWGGYSRTTMKHVNDFRMAHDLPALNKAQWLAMPCARFPYDYADGLYKVRFYNRFTSWLSEVIFDDYADAEAWAEKVCADRGIWYDVEQIDG